MLRDVRNAGVMNRPPGDAWDVGRDKQCFERALGICAACSNQTATTPASPPPAALNSPVVLSNRASMGEEAGSQPVQQINTESGYRELIGP